MSFFLCSNSPLGVVGVGRLTMLSLLVVLATAAENRLVEVCVGRSVRLDVTILASTFSQSEKTPLDSVPVELTISSLASLLCTCTVLSLPFCLLLGDTRLPKDFTLCHRGLDEDANTLLVLDGLLFVLVILLFVTRSLETGTFDFREGATNCGLISFFSLLAGAVGERIALILTELRKGTEALFGTKTGGALVFSGTAAGTRRLDIVEGLTCCKFD